MKRWFKISALLLVYCLTTAKSCSNGEERKAELEQARVVAVRDSIHSVFASDSLPEGTLRAYEATARQKLYDLCDFFNIMADTSLDKAFRNTAADMASGLFIADTIMLNLCTPDNPGRKVFTVPEFMKEGFVPGNCHFGSITVIKPLTRMNDSTYCGCLAFIEKGPQKSRGAHLKSPGHGNTADIYTIRRMTVLGSDSLKTWKVLLGKISCP
jgi:hypothetical protein